MQKREFWNHYEGYSAARAMVSAQSLDADLRTIDSLFGREGLRYGATPEDVKAEALRQLEIEWRSERNQAAEFAYMAGQAARGF